MKRPSRRGRSQAQNHRWMLFISVLRTSGFIIFLAILVLFIIAIFLYQKDMTPFWQGIITNLLSSLITALIIVVLTAFGVPTIQEQFRRSQQLQKFGELPRFWRTDKSDLGYTIICGKEKAHLHSAEPEPRIGYAEAFGLLLLTQTLHQITEKNTSIRQELVDEDGSLKESWFNGHVILLGSELSIKHFGNISRASGIKYFQFDMTRDTLPRTLQFDQSGRKISMFESILDEKGQAIRRDYGSVVRIVRPGNRLLILLNGNYGAGLLASIFAVTRREEPEDFSLDDFYPDEKAQEVVVQVEDFADNLLRPYDLISRPDGHFHWYPFNLHTEQLDQAIRDSWSNVPPSSQVAKVDNT